MNLTIIIESIIALVVTLITTFAIPFIRSKIQTDKLNTLVFWIERAVFSVEEADRKGVINKQEKYDMVVKFLEEKGYNLDTDELRTLIDGAVYDLINQFKEVVDGE
jgi:Phage holin protein (Holin_LLH).